MTELRSDKSQTQRTRRKRRVTRQSGDGIIDSDDNSVNDDFSTAKWSYDLSAALVKKEFEHSDMYDTISAEQFNIDLIRRTGLSKPFLITDPPSKFNFKMPDSDNFDVEDVRRLVGGSRFIEVVEVATQGSRKMLLDDFVDYYKKSPENRPKLLNVLSLEFSHCPLENLVSAPALIRKVDWVDLFWPKELQSLDQESDPAYGPFNFPKVKQYCLMSVKDCFTDFHIDFGGTSVWYHVLKGKKVFWMVEPTEQNLTLYEEWILNTSAGDSAFFGDIVERCLRVELSAGDTFIIPSGWIHGVYTPVDSLVFGGNFLHSYSIPMQLRVLRCEEKIKITKKYRYPYYNEMLWYVANGVVKFATGHSYAHLLNFKNEKNEESKASKSSGTDIANKNDKTEGMSMDCNVQSPSCPKENVQVEKLEISCLAEERSKDSPLQFNKEYLRLMTNFEYEGYNLLLRHLRKKLNTKQRHEIAEKFSDPDLLLDTFEKLLQQKLEVDKHLVECGNVYPGKKAVDDLSVKDYGVEILLDDTKSETNDLNLTNSSNFEFGCNDVALNVEVATCQEENLSEVTDDAVLAHRVQSKQSVVAAGLEKSDSESLSDIDNEAVQQKSSEESVAKDTVNRTVLDSDDFEIDVVGHDSATTEESGSQEKRSVKNSTMPAKSVTKKRGVKRKLLSKVKATKSKNRKNDGLNSDRPLIVGGLPPAIMPADAPEVPNPYQYDPKAAVTALGHRQLRAAYRVTRDMAQVPPTQKFRLHPIRRTTSTVEGTMATDLSLESPEKEKPIDTVCTVTSTSGETPTSDSVRTDSITSHDMPEKEVVRKQDSSSPSGAAKDHILRHTPRAGREKRLLDHSKTSVEFEYKSPLAHTYVHSAVPSSSTSSSIRTVVGHVKKFSDDSGVKKRLTDRPFFKEGNKYFERQRRRRFSPPSRRLSSEEIWDRCYGRESENARFGHKDGGPYNQRFRRFSHGQEHSRFRGFSRQDESYRDYSPVRSECQKVFEKRKSFRDGHFNDFSSSSADLSHQNVWKRPPGFDPSVPPPFLPRKHFKEGVERTSRNVYSKSEENKNSSSESWRKLGPNPSAVSKDFDAGDANNGSKKVPEQSSISVNNCEVKQQLLGPSRKDDRVTGEAFEASTSAQSSAVVGHLQKSTSNRETGTDEFAEAYRPTPICNLPPRPDSILGIPPIVFEHDHTVTGILKRPNGPRSVSYNNLVSPKLPQETKEDAPRVIAGFGGTSVVGNDGRSTTESPSTVDEQNKFSLTNDTKKEPLDYVSTANELARLTSEITEEPLHSKVEPRLKKSDSSTILTDPRRARNIVHQDEISDNNVSENVESLKENNREQQANESANTLFEDLSSLIAEYDEIDE